MNQLAEKAMFSQYTLTRQELSELTFWKNRFENQLRKQSFLRRMMTGLIFAAWG